MSSYVSSKKESAVARTHSQKAIPIKNIIFCMVRMNPPTPGHLLIIKAMIEKAIETDSNEIFVFLSKTNDNRGDPIPCPEKDAILREMVEQLKQEMDATHIRVHIECETESASLFSLLSNTINSNQQYELNLIFVIGEDRDTMSKSVGKFAEKFDNVEKLDTVVLNRPNMDEFIGLSKNAATLDELSMASIPREAISASFVRNIVGNDRKDKFTELYSPFLKKREISQLYASIEHGLRMPTKEEVTRLKAQTKRKSTAKKEKDTGLGRRKKQKTFKKLKKNRKTKRRRRLSNST